MHNEGRAGDRCIMLISEARGAPSLQHVRAIPINSQAGNVGGELRPSAYAERITILMSDSQIEIELEYVIDAGTSISRCQHPIQYIQNVKIMQRNVNLVDYSTPLLHALSISCAQTGYIFPLSLILDSTHCSGLVAHAHSQKEKSIITARPGGPGTLRCVIM